MAKVIQTEGAIESGESLGSEVLALFRDAVSYRNCTGVTASLQNGYVRDTYDDDAQDDLPAHASSCGCDAAKDESCSLCDNQLKDICTLDQVMTRCKEVSPFAGTASLLATVKKYEFIALAENAYAQIGNKPFKLEATKEVSAKKGNLRDAAKRFYEFLDNFLKENDVKIGQIPAALNLDTMGEVSTALASSAKHEAILELDKSLGEAETILERIFNRANYMREYLEVLKDTGDYPIGVMWLDDKVLKRERLVSASGTLTHSYTIQCDATRIDPCHFWATEDHQLNAVGRAVFKYTQLTAGDLKRWKNSQTLLGSTKLGKNISDYLDLHADGYRMYDAMLFRGGPELDKGFYDVITARGVFKRENIKEYLSKIPKLFEYDDYIPCEVSFSGTTILGVRVLEFSDEHLGVHTTVFRRRGQSIFGYSLHDFIYPFAKLYEGNLDAIDRTMGKAIGSLIQIDVGAIVDPEKYLEKNEKTGEVTLNLSDDVLVEFDSSNVINPNFKGVPIHVTQLPNDLSKLLPMMDFIFQQLEKISGIPSILVNANNVSSALRTTENFNAAFTASSSSIRALLRESETRILRPSIDFFFEVKAASGDMKDFLIEAEPKILLSDTLTREHNDDQNILESLRVLSAFSTIIPQEKLASLLNLVGRKVYNLDEDLVPGAGPLNVRSPDVPAQAL